MNSERASGLRVSADSAPDLAASLPAVQAQAQARATAAAHLREWHPARQTDPDWLHDRHAVLRSASRTRTRCSGELRGVSVVFGVSGRRRKPTDVSRCAHWRPPVLWPGPRLSRVLLGWPPSDVVGALLLPWCARAQASAGFPAGLAVCGKLLRRLFMETRLYPLT